MINEEKRFIPEQQPKPIVEEESQNEYNKTDTENPEKQERKKMAKINDLQKEKNQLTGKIERARNNLGLPPTDEEPPSVRALNAKIQKIENEDITIDQSQTEVDEDAEKAEKNEFLPFIDSVKSIKNIFNDRRDRRLNPLIDEQKFDMLKTVSFNIENMFNQKISRKDWFNNLAVEIDRIRSVIDSKGIKSSLREDPDSLRNFGFKLNILEKVCNSIIIKQNQEQKLREKNQTIETALKNLSQSCKDKLQFIARLKRHIDDYGGGGRRI